MKKLLILIYLLFHILSEGQGQTIAIPDPMLRSCLAENLPAVLDAKKDLILTEAAKIKGEVNCRSKGITNADGVQYFINATRLDISYNNISFLPDISPLKKLTILDISDNNIDKVTGLGAITGLKDLDIKNNKIKELPSFASHLQLEVLSASFNEILILPSLENNTKLKFLSISDNKLMMLPGLNHLTLLTNIEISNNLLSVIPEISNLKLLQNLSIGGNQVKELPSLPMGGLLRKIDAGNNNIATLPDITGLDSLYILDVSNNYLTFYDLLLVLQQRSKLSNFNYSPQKNSEKSTTVSVTEFETLILPAGIDTGIVDIRYQWMKDSDTLISANDETYSDTSVTLNDEGYYYCQINHPSFPDLTLHTDSVLIQVSKCLNEENFSFVIQGITCSAPGSLKVIPGIQPGSNLTYTLKAVKSEHTIASVNGVFSQLTQPLYNLLVSNGAKCVKQLPRQIEIAKENCEYPFITPDGDGLNDSYFIDKEGKAIISDKWGNKIKELSLPAEWNGMGSNETVAPGLYFIDINDGQALIKMSVFY